MRVQMVSLRGAHPSSKTESAVGRCAQSSKVLAPWWLPQDSALRNVSTQVAHQYRGLRASEQ